MLDVVLNACEKSGWEIPQLCKLIKRRLDAKLGATWHVVAGEGYSFDVDEASAALAYKKVFISYLRTFRRLGLSAIPMQADTGPIGGDLSHEFLIQAETGESEVFFDSAISADPAFTEDLTGDAELEAAFDRLTSAYARTDETHDAALFDQQHARAALCHKAFVVSI